MKTKPFIDNTTLVQEEKLGFGPQYVIGHDTSPRNVPSKYQLEHMMVENMN